MYIFCRPFSIKTVNIIIITMNKQTCDDSVSKRIESFCIKDEKVSLIDSRGVIINLSKSSAYSVVKDILDIHFNVTFTSDGDVTIGEYKLNKLESFEFFNKILNDH